MSHAYYITEYSDEIMPCEATLAGWAEWLSKPDPEWDRDAAADDGATFSASVMRFEADIIATRVGDDWVFSRDPAGADFLAVRFGEHLGWSPDAIIWGEDMTRALREWLTENADYCDDHEFVAVGTDEPDVRLVFQAGPPPSLSVVSVQ